MKRTSYLAQVASIFLCFLSNSVLAQFGEGHDGATSLPAVMSANTQLPDFGSGTGGVGGLTITSINGVKLPPVVPPSQIVARASNIAYSQDSQTFNGIVTLKNISASEIKGPLQIVFMGVTTGVTLVNATNDLSGTPYLTLAVPSALAPNQSVTVSVQFKNPSNTTINFTPVVYSGIIN